MLAQGQPLGVIESPALTTLGPRTLTPAASAHLDLVRALAAWAVLWGHVRGNLFVDFQHVQHRGLPQKVLYFLTGFGHQAVMVFFVLSGFLISSSVIYSWASGTWSWRDYAINRSSRLYAVLIPGLLFGLLWDRIGSTLLASTGLYAQPLEGFGSAIARNQLTVGTFFGNLFFLQTIVCQTFGSNGPLWSLSNEFWYYVLFPVGLFAGLAWAKRSVRRAIPFTLLAFGLVIFLGVDKFIGFLIWMAGCGLVIAHARLRPVKHWLIFYNLISVLALAICLIAARTGTPRVLGTDFAVGIAFALFLFSVLYADSGTASGHYHDVARFFAGFSYSLYVLHFPLLLFIRACLAPQRWQPDGRHLFYGALVGAAVVTFAWLVSTFTESKTRVVRNWMKAMTRGLDGRSY